MYLLEKGQIPRGARKVQNSTKLKGAGLRSVFPHKKRTKQGLANPHPDGR